MPLVGAGGEYWTLGKGILGASVPSDDKVKIAAKTLLTANIKGLGEV